MLSDPCILPAPLSSVPRQAGLVFSSERLVLGSASGYTKVNAAIIAFLLMREEPAEKMPNHSEMLHSSWDLMSQDKFCVQKREQSTMILSPDWAPKGPLCFSELLFIFFENIFPMKL